ncbi:conserved hypothetical protein [Desulfonatronospira thiodismutans ASO3-1]|uniref:Uncharacterized protein n=1 Tax=Desulfonatronospira thiodismutans ASO3-1 TaxID=555779 RepID=D6STY4_9BACT|nr:hypothetical protein [Desulfonatronospira thiodismutans]EFI34150.1 conserved hypothetical protein [Desulfonatronospira thiodismutans ASO3-1]
MIEATQLTPKEIRSIGWDVLLKKLGPNGALQFILDYEKGYGNYCELRKEIFKDKTVQDLVQEMKNEGYA